MRIKRGGVISQTWRTSHSRESKPPIELPLHTNRQAARRRRRAAQRQYRVLMSREFRLELAGDKDVLRQIRGQHGAERKVLATRAGVVPTPRHMRRPSRDLKGGALRRRLAFVRRLENAAAGNGDPHGWRPPMTGELLPHRAEALRAARAHGHRQVVAYPVSGA